MISSSLLSGFSPSSKVGSMGEHQKICTHTPCQKTVSQHCILLTDTKRFQKFVKTQISGLAHITMPYVQQQIYKFHKIKGLNINHKKKATRVLCNKGLKCCKQCWWWMTGNGFRSWGYPASSSHLSIALIPLWTWDVPLPSKTIPVSTQLPILPDSLSHIISDTVEHD